MPAYDVDQNTKQAVERFLALISKDYDVAGAVLFGSRARGTHDPDSDADVAVILNGEHQRVMTVTVAMSDVAYEVLLETGVNISPVPIWADEWDHPDRHRNPDLINNISTEGFRL